MSLRTDVIKFVYECDSCENEVSVGSMDPEDMPPGYHIFLRRVTRAKHHRISDAMFFCTKDCLLDGMQFRITHLTREVGKIT